MKLVKLIGIVLLTMSLFLSFGCSKKDANTEAKLSTTDTKVITADSKASSSAPTPKATEAPTPTPKKTGPFDGGFTSDAPLEYSLFTMDTNNELSATKTLYQINDPDMTISGYFGASTDFNYITVFCPSWGDDIGSLTLSIYNWNTDYNKTMNGTPIKSQDYANYKDNSWLKLKFDAPLPAGEYIWALSCTADISEGVGIWSVEKGPAGYEKDVKSYVFDQEVETYHMVRIGYTKTPKNLLVKS